MCVCVYVGEVHVHTVAVKKVSVLAKQNRTDVSVPFYLPSPDVQSIAALAFPLLCIQRRPQLLCFKSHWLSGFSDMATS